MTRVTTDFHLLGFLQNMTEMKMRLVCLSGLFLCIIITIPSMKSFLLFINIYLVFIVMYFLSFS